MNIPSSSQMTLQEALKEINYLQLNVARMLAFLRDHLERPDELGEPTLMGETPFTRRELSVMLLLITAWSHSVDKLIQSMHQTYHDVDHRADLILTPPHMSSEAAAMRQYNKTQDCLTGKAPHRLLPIPPDRRSN